VKGRGGLPRPAKAAGPVLASVFGLVGWAAVAHNSGSGWVQALGCLLAGFVLLGLGGGAFATARASVEVLACPTDATAGQPVVVEVRVSAPLRVEPLVPPGPPVVVGSGVGAIELVPSRRGLVDHLRVRVGSAAPFGLLWWRKPVELALPRPLWVAPVAAGPERAVLASDRRSATLDGARHRDARTGEIRGVRPYVPGDPQHTVHWPSSAHRGELMVREAEWPDEAVSRLEVVLPDDGPAGDVVAARALGTLVELLASGHSVVLSTTERTGPRTEAVSNPVAAGRRLARAVAPR